MWTPTHVQVTVQRAKGLLLKGKNGTNDAFVTISLGKEKYQTSVKERAGDPVDWHEECELAIPRHGNKAEIVLTVLHRNFIGDEFLGQATIPLSDFDVYDKAKSRWYSLKCKPGQDKTNYRGDIEVKVSFTVQSGVTQAGSLADLKGKEGIRGSLGNLGKKVGGSLLSLKGKGEGKGLKGLAKAVGNKVNKVSTLPGRGKKKGSEGDIGFGVIEESEVGGSGLGGLGGWRKNEADPGVISDEDEDEFRFDELSHKSSHSSLSVSQVALERGGGKEGSLENLGGGEFLRRNYATPPRGDKKEERREVKSGPVDDWETKLFGKQQGILEKAGSLNRRSLGAVEIEERKEEEDKNEDERRSSFKEDPLKPTFQSIFSTGLQNNKVVSTGPNNPPPPAAPEAPKEPIPKPRQSAISAPSPPPKEEPPAPKPKAPAPPPPNPFEETKSTPPPKPLKKAAAEITKTATPPPTPPTLNTSKDSSLITPKIVNDNSDDVPNQKWTPVGITNPIRQKSEPHQETRLPREILKKFESKSREDLIEMLMKQQTTLEYQKQKLNDMEDYIDNLLVRVLENTPNLLQTPYVTHRPMK